MAETLTFEDTTEQTSLENLNTDEQDSLKVGEAMQEEQENLLAGKYKDAKDLETAYIELQKKLGSNETSAEETETESKEEVKEEESSEPNLLDTIWEESQNDKYSDETLAKLKSENKLLKDRIKELSKKLSVYRDIKENFLKLQIIIIRKNNTQINSPIFKLFKY